MKTFPYEESLTIAEQACFRHLCEKLGRASGRDAFVSVNPGVADCIVFDIGSGYTGDLNTWRSGYGHMRAQMDIYSRDRKELQKMIMRTMRDLPCEPAQGEPIGDSNVVHFRLAPESGNPGEIRTTDIDLGTDKKPIRVFTCSIVFDVVFVCPRDLTVAP